MKTINVTFEDKEFNDLVLIKGLSTSWREFILTLVIPKHRVTEGVKEAKLRIKTEKRMR